MIPINLWINNVKICIEEMANSGYQQKAWIEGKGTNPYASYGEAMCELYDFASFVPFLEYLNSWGFSSEFVELIKNFNKELREFGHNEAVGKTDSEIISHPKWPKLVRDAQMVLFRLEDEHQKLNIPDDAIVGPTP